MVFCSGFFAFLVLAMSLNIVSSKQITTLLQLKENSPQAIAIESTLDYCKNLTDTIINASIFVANSITKKFGIDIDFSKVKATQTDRNTTQSLEKIPDSQDDPSNI
jgi:hypothetical protein